MSGKRQHQFEFLSAPYDEKSGQALDGNTAKQGYNSITLFLFN